jgi:hypothetical protein
MRRIICQREQRRKLSLNQQVKIPAESLVGTLANSQLLVVVCPELVPQAKEKVSKKS